MGAEREADLRPLVVVVLHGDAAAGALLGAHRPVLLEGTSTLDRRLVDARRLVDLVRALLGREVAHRSPRLVRCQVAVRFNHVVLDQWIAGLFLFVCQSEVEEVV